MPYLKINGKSTKYNVDLAPFTTQHGKRAVRFIGDEIPTTNKGFKYYNDNDELIVDMSAYVYQYRQNEYTMEQDEIVMPLPNDDPIEPSVLDRMNARINRVSSQVYAITPYTESKTVGIQDTECIFTDAYRDGVLSATLKTEQGEFLPCTVERADSRIRVSFEPLSEVATVTIQIQ